MTNINCKFALTFLLADGWTPIWDVFGNMVENLLSQVPLLSVGGNHEIAGGENWQSYSARYPTNPQDSNSPNLCYHGREVGPMNIISLCSYGAMNYGGLNTGATSLQYQWLTNYLTTINRIRTPWVMVQFHAPMYSTNSFRYMEGEIFRRQYEALLYKYGVDIVMNGHVHAYERSFPVYNNTMNPCGAVHLVLGDAGNYKNADVPWNMPQKSWSAFREASFGVASLTILSSTTANITWHRHACGSATGGAPTYNQNFSSSCVTPGDNSANIAQSVDTVLLTKPSMATCPNRYVSSVPFPSAGPTVAPYPSNTGYARKALAVDAVDEPSPVDRIRVLFEVAPEETTGEGYRRLLEPMLQFVPPVVTCPSSQVHLTNGGSGHNSMTVNWVNPSLLSANTVSYGMDTTMSSTATGKAQAYTQLLGAQSTNLITPSMGQAGSTAAVMIGLANTSTFAYDHDTGRRWANYNNAYGTKKTPTGQLNFSDPFAFYDSPMIHTTVLSNLVAGKLYYYKPAGACKTYNFTMTQAVNTYPFKAGLLADLGTTDVSAMSVAVLIAMNANVIVFTGDLSYGKRNDMIFGVLD